MKRLAQKAAFDLVVWTLATPFAFAIRTDSFSLEGYLPSCLLMMGLLVPVKALLIQSLGLYRHSWRNVSLRDVVELQTAVLIVAVLSYAAVFFSGGLIEMPRSVPLIEAIVALLGLGGVRVALRLFLEQQGNVWPSKGRGSQRRVLIAGAGEAGLSLAREMLRSPTAGLLPIGFLDDDNAKQRTRYYGFRVLGRLKDLPTVAEAHQVDELLIAIPSATGSVVRRLVESANRIRLQHRIVPGLSDLISGRVSISQIRPVNVEDLLRREPVRLDMSAIETYLSGRRVLVTGAGGSIGAEIVRQVARFNPESLLLLGRGENSIFHIDREVRRLVPDLTVHSFIADVRDAAKLEEIFARFRPQVVFHAAAHKHVPLMESNPDQAIFNNVVGTRNVTRMAREYEVERLVNISTDKAVNPTSVMGASKRVAELVVTAAAREAAPEQHFMSVRFGNVLGSRGSVIPMFREQIAQGGPVMVTHPDMVRYFMTIPEAAQLVLQAGGMEENGAVFVLDMGEPVRILDLARDLILLSGLRPDQDIRIAFTGTRPGEKLFEELLTAEEGTEVSHHEKIYRARNESMAATTFDDLYEQLLEAASCRDGIAIRRMLQQLVPTASFELLREDPVASAEPA